MKHYNCGEHGDHINQIIIKTPDAWVSTKEFFSVDPCIAPEIVFLIIQGVRTLNSCCGHNRVNSMPSVCVDTNSIGKMKELGYKNDLSYENRKEIFLLNRYSMVEEEKGINDI